MSIIDDYNQSMGDEDAKPADPMAGRKKRAELERQIVILDSDLKKIVREIEDMEQQKRKFKKEEERIRIERDELDKNIKKIENDWTYLEDQIRGLKKKLKTL